MGVVKNNSKIKSVQSADDLTVAVNNRISMKNALDEINKCYES